MFSFQYAGDGVADSSITWSEAMRIDSSGNLLVGNTEANPASGNVAGVRLSSANSQFSADGTTPVYINRKTSDGTILDLRKDGSTVGSIGVASSNRLYFAGGNSALTVLTDEVYPATNTGAAADGNMNIGSAGARFNNLYLSGGVVFGDAGGSGTSSSNTLDSYEEGTWSPRYSAATGGQIGGSQQGVGTYTKIGNTVNLRMYLYISNISVAGFSGSVSVVNLPFTVVSSYLSTAKTTTTQSTGTYGAFVTAPTHAAVNTGATSIALFKPLAAQTENKLQVADFATASGNRNYVAFDITYQVA